LICQAESCPRTPVSLFAPEPSFSWRVSARECAGSVDIRRTEWRECWAAVCNARAQATVVFPTPPLPTTNLSFATKRFYRTRLNGFGGLIPCLPHGKRVKKNASGDIQPLAEYIHSLIVPKAVRRSLGGVNLCGLYAPVHFLDSFRAQSR